MKINLYDIKHILLSYKGEQGALIPLLQEIQQLFGYVPEKIVKLISKELEIPEIKIYEVLTFYNQFYLEPRGKYVVRICEGTACYIMGGKTVLEHLVASLGIQIDETTKDGLFTLERVACLGCCGMAPVIMINDEFYGHCTVDKLNTILNDFKKGNQ